VIARLLAVLPIAVAAAALGWSCSDPTPASAVAVLGVVFALVGPRFELDRGRQLVTSAIGGGVGWLLVTMLYAPRGPALAEGWARFAAAAILAGAARLVIVRPSGGRMATMVLLFAALVAAGQTHTGGFGVFVALFVVTGVWLPAARAEHELLGETSGRRLAVAVAILSITAGVAASGAIGLRRAYAWMVNRQRLTALTYEPSVGFSDQMDLGSLDGLVDSDTVVLRVRGGHVDYLRGAVLDFYAVGRWGRSDAASPETPDHYDGDTRPAGGVQIVAVGGPTDRVFLPLQAREVAISPPSVTVDPLGAVHLPGKHAETTLRFVTGDRDRARPASPGPDDLQIPRSLRARVEGLAAGWTRDAPTIDGKLDALRHHLRADFTYARGVHRPGGDDPVIQFLFADRRGHCEYFATAMALLARSQGIPARVVMGFRVGEESPFGYEIVREKNAHSWVEAWVPGTGWATYDPTPDIEIPQNRQHRSGYLASLIDEAGVSYAQFVDWLQRRTLEETAVAWTAGLVVLFWIVARGNRRRARAEAPRPDDAPLACLTDLLESLARAGHPHESHESIERFAARLPDPEAARLLERCAALRYGSVGDPGALAADVGRYMRQQKRRGVSAPE
jgi:transglutaminase-like putative cysteine protease